MAGKPKDLRYEEAALWKRIEYVENLKEALTSEGTIFSETVREYTRLMDGKTLVKCALATRRASSILTQVTWLRFHRLLLGNPSFSSTALLFSSFASLF